MEPIMTPFTKYFCANGYTHRIGSVANTINEYFMRSAMPCIISAISSSMRSEA